MQMKSQLNYAVVVATLLLALCCPGSGRAESQETGETAPPPVTESAAGQTPAPAETPAAREEDDRLPFMVRQETGAEQPGGFWLLARTLGALIVVLGVLVASVWFLRRLKGAALDRMREDARLTVLSTVTLGDRRALSVVRFGDRTLLLGMTPQSITLLASEDWERPVRSVAEVLVAGEETTPEQEKSFSDELEQYGTWSN